MPNDSLDPTLDRYVALLYHWNRRVRLVGERDAAEFRSTHLAEVLVALPLAADADWDIAVDVGSGNGLVAIPLAAAQRGRRVVALEPRQRKAAFLRQAALELGLPNLEVRQETLQAFTPPAGAGLLWAARALEIPAGEFIAALRRHPGSLLLLFTGPGTPSRRLLERGGGTFQPVGQIAAGGSAARQVVLVRIAGECFT